MGDTAKAQVLSLMRKMIGKEAENKEIGNNIEVLVTHNSAITNPDMKPVVPQIASGTSGQTRLGDRIKPKSLYVRGVIAARSDISNVLNKPLLVRVIIASQKDVKVGSSVGVRTDPAHLLKPADPGAGVEVAFNGNRNEINYPVNDNKFRVYYDKTFTIAPAAGAGVEQQPKNYFRFRYRFKQLPATLSWDDANGDWANNFAPFFCVGYAFADGSSPDTLTTRLISDVYSHLSYEDA